MALTDGAIRAHSPSAVVYKNLLEGRAHERYANLAAETIRVHAPPTLQDDYLTAMAETTRSASGGLFQGLPMLCGWRDLSSRVTRADADNIASCQQLEYCLL